MEGGGKKERVGGQVMWRGVKFSKGAGGKGGAGRRSRKGRKGRGNTAGGLGQTQNDA